MAIAAIPLGPAVHFCAPITTASAFHVAGWTGSPPTEVIPSRMNATPCSSHICASDAAS